MTVGALNRIILSIGSKKRSNIKIGKICYHHHGYSTGNQHRKTGGFSNYLKSLKWFSIPASIGFAYIAYLQFRHIQKREKRNIEHGSPKSLILEEWQVDILKLLPTRVLSRWWGNLSHVKLPLWMRKPLFAAYVKVYDCNMEESIVEDVRQFPTFSEFFKRKLKPEARIIEDEGELVSPVDGKVLYFGEVDSSYNLEQVKGVKYSLVSFLGPKHPFVKRLIKQKKAENELRNTKDVAEDIKDLNSFDMDSFNPNDNGQELTKNNDMKEKLYYCIIYLAPGDYHWFHSPADWTIEHRRHIPGHLFSVNPFVMKSVQGLFNINERVILNGNWKHGSLLMAAVGAYNVGSIHLEFAIEKTLKTNHGKLENNYIDRLYGASGFSFKRGERLGGFDLGSSIVLIFTAKDNMCFRIQPGQKIKLGETIARTT